MVDNDFLARRQRLGCLHFYVLSENVSSMSRSALVAKNAVQNASEIVLGVFSRCEYVVYVSS